MRANGPKERRWRIIHSQVIRDAEVAQRMARLGIIAEVQPYHAIDDMRWMEERIGARARWAYAFETLQRAGVASALAATGRARTRAGTQRVQCSACMPP